MKVAISQSNYLPWRGYFDLIASVDLFLVYDDVQFTHRDWRNRNRVKTPHGTRWLTVPVRHDAREQLICDTRIDYSRDWRRDHWRTIAESYARARHTRDVLTILEAAFDAQPETLTQMNVTLLTAFCRYLGIRTTLRLSTEFDADGRRTDRLLDLLRRVGATAYVSGPRGRDYLEEAKFRAAGIGLEYKCYDYPPYPQLWGPFESQVSIVDVIANCGEAARNVTVTGQPNEVAA